MLEKLEILKRGLDVANKEGCFTLDESSLLMTTYVQLKSFLNETKEDINKQAKEILTSELKKTNDKG